MNSNENLKLNSGANLDKLLRGKNVSAVVGPLSQAVNRLLGGVDGGLGDAKAVNLIRYLLTAEVIVEDQDAWDAFHTVVEFLATIKFHYPYLKAATIAEAIGPFSGQAANQIASSYPGCYHDIWEVVRQFQERPAKEPDPIAAFREKLADAYGQDSWFEIEESWPTLAGLWDVQTYTIRLMDTINRHSSMYDELNTQVAKLDELINAQIAVIMALPTTNDKLDWDELKMAYDAGTANRWWQNIEGRNRELAQAYRLHRQAYDIWKEINHNHVNQAWEIAEFFRHEVDLFLAEQ